MKITYLTTSFPQFKGDYSGIFILNLARHITPKGIDIDVIVPEGDISIKKREKLYNINISRFSYIYPRRFQKLCHGFGGMLSNLKNNKFVILQMPLLLFSFLVKSFIATKDSDIIHAHWIISGAVALAIKKIRKIPVVITVRGSDINTLKKKGISKKILLCILKDMDLITTVSREFTTWLEDNGINKKLIRYIPNGVDTGLFKKSDNKSKLRAELNLPFDEDIIVYVGTLTPNKGVNILIEAVSLISKKRKGFKFIIIGDGTERGLLEELTIKYNITDIVSFAGYQSASLIPKWLKAADIFAFASYYEGRPNSVLEAMSSELPIVASNIPGCAEIIDDTRSGFLISPGNIDHFSDKIEHLLSSPEEREKVGSEARKKIIEMGLSWNFCADEFIKGYREILMEQKV